MATADAGGQALWDATLADAPAWKRWYLRSERLVLGSIGVVSVLLLWEGSVRLGLLRPIFLSSPTAIFRQAQAEFRGGEVWTHIGVSLLEFSLGFIAAAVVGIVVGVVAGWYRRPNYIIEPWLAALNATPVVALFPFIIIVMGIGLWSKVFVVFLIAFFAVAINTLVGVQAAEARYLDVARSFGARQLTMLKTVILPGATPEILTGLRVATGRAVVGVVIGELLGAQAGVGHMVLTASYTLNTPQLMFAIVLLGTFGVVLGEAMRWVEHKAEVWRPQRSS